MKRHLLALPLLFALPVSAQEAEPPTPASVVDVSAPEEWVAIAPEDLLVMDLAPDDQGRARQVMIQLMPAPFSQPWVENIRKLARAHWWDGTQVYRVVDNWVVQWGAGEDGGEAGFAPHPLPEEARAAPASAYESIMACQTYLMNGRAIGQKCTPELTAIAAIDSYNQNGETGLVAGWPVAMKLEDGRNKIWPIHCYGSVGVARDLAPDTGTGAELYAVIGHAPRQLDRNIAVVGRVISGIEHLSTLPRGTAEAGVYETRAEDTPIVSVRLGDELPEQPHFEYLGTDSASFARYVQVRANRNDAFYTVPAGGVDVCNVQVPIRPAAL